MTTGGGPIDFDSGSRVTPPASLGCSECLFQGCRPEWAVCQNDAECRAIYDCSTVAGLTQAQVTACFCMHPTGESKYSALAACDQVSQCGSCKSNCSSTPASSCANPGVFQAVDCSGTAVDSGSPAADSGGAVDAGPGPAVTDAATVTDCASCTSSKCASQIAACNSGSECDKFTLCTAACHDSACFNKCGTDHPSGKQASADLNACTTTSCAKECGL